MGPWNEIYHMLATFGAIFTGIIVVGYILFLVYIFFKIK